MSDIEARALALVNEVGFIEYASFYDVDEAELRDTILHLIRERDAFRQEVSERMLNLMSAYGVSREDVADFIIAKPDPLVEAVKALQDGRSGSDPESYAACLRNELKSRGLEIREVGQ
jgi:hypothetical protein